MASVFEVSKAWFVLCPVLWFAKFQFLKFAYLVIRNYRYEYYKKTGKYDENIIGGVKRKDGY